MILFKTTNWEWDLTNKGISLNEVSEFFSDKQTKSFTLPFNVNINQDVTDKLGLINVDDVVDYQERIYGFLVIDSTFYNGYIQINEVVGDRVELTIFYGVETLKVFDKKLKDLPFPVVLATPTIEEFALAQIGKQYPEATHNFPRIYRDEISSRSNYDLFENFINNMKYNDIDEEWYFPTNENELIEGVNTAANRNIITPMPYLLEVLRVGFASEGLDLRGDLVNDEVAKTMILVPQQFMEVFSAAQYSNYSFSTYTFQETVGTTTYNVYRNTHTPSAVGEYSLKIKINLPASIAQYFKLTVVQDTATLFEAESQNQDVNINQTLDITIANTLVFDDIIVELRLLQQPNSIANFNNFTYEYKEGSLNIFSNVYTLADYMPDMTFRDLFNKVKTWLNIKPDYTDNAVYLNYIENSIQNLVFKSKTHLQVPKPKVTLNTNNLFKLQYLDGQTVFVNKDGQTFDESDFESSETTEIESDVLPLQVKDNFGVLTAVYPEDEEELMVCLFPGTFATNETVLGINGKTLTQQQVYERHFKQWLKYRANSKTIKETFYMHFTEDLDIYTGVFKYNKKMLMTKIEKKRITDEHYKVTVTGETF